MPELFAALEVASVSTSAQVRGAEYEYYTFDLATKAIIQELPLEASELTESLNNFDQVRFSLPLNDTSKLPLGWQYSVTAKRTGIVALRDGQAVWSGIIWEANTANNGLAKELLCITLIGFYAYQTLDVDMPFNQVDQHTIVRAIGQYNDTLPGGNIGVDWGTGLSGTLRDRNEYFGAEHKSILDIWRGLAGVNGGVDFRIQTDKISGQYVSHTFKVGTPLGISALESGFVFDYTDEPGVTGSGNIDEYDIAAPGLVTAVWVIGAGEGVDMASVLVENTPLLNSGFPRIVRVLTKKSVSDPDTLAGHAVAELKEAGKITPEVTVQGDSWPAIGTYNIGDFCQLRITSPEYPRQADGTPGLVLSARIYRRSINPNTDQVKLTLQPLDQTVDEGADI